MRWKWMWTAWGTRTLEQETHIHIPRLAGFQNSSFGKTVFEQLALRFIINICHEQLQFTGLQDIPPRQSPLNLPAGQSPPYQKYVNVPGVNVLGGDCPGVISRGECPRTIYWLNYLCNQPNLLKREMSITGTYNIPSTECDIPLLVSPLLYSCQLHWTNLTVLLQK